MVRLELWMGRHLLRVLPTMQIARLKGSLDIWKDGRGKHGGQQAKISFALFH